MATDSITREFTARKSTMSGDYTPMLVPKDPIVNDKIFEDIINNDRMTISASEYRHLVERFFIVLSGLVASDETDRVVSGICKAKAVASGHLESPSDPWNDTCDVTVRVQLLSETTKKGDSAISHVNANEGIKVKLNYVTYLGAQGVQNVIKSLTAFASYGNHMEFDAAAGDTAVLAYEKDGKTVEVPLTCTASDVASATFEFPKEIIALEGGTALTFIMKSRGGVTDGAIFTNKKTVTYLGYTGDPLVWNISTEGLAKNTVKVDDTKLVTINGAKLNGCEQVALTLTTKDGTTDAIAIPAADLVSNTADKVTLHFTQAMVDATTLKNHDLAGATGKLMFAGEEGMVSEYAFSYAE